MATAKAEIYYQKLKHVSGEGGSVLKMSKIASSLDTCSIHKQWSRIVDESRVTRITV